MMAILTGAEWYPPHYSIDLRFLMISDEKHLEDEKALAHSSWQRWGMALLGCYKLSYRAGYLSVRL